MLKYFNTNEKILKINNVDVLQLVREYGTPLYVYSTGIIKKQYLSINKYLPDRTSIFYAIKANPNLSICSFLRSLGAGAEIASSGELFVALKTGFTPEKIIFDGPGKTIEDLEYAIRTGIYLINAESIEELYRINTIAKSKSKRVNVCIRINPIVGVNKAKIYMGGEHQKFGVDEEKAESIIRSALELDSIELSGIHISTGSQIADHSELLKNAENTINIACEFSDKFRLPLKCINLGGGIGVPYDENDSEIDIESFGKGLSNIIEKKSGEYDLEKTEFILEPGRYLTAESGVYLTRVIDIKESRGKKYAIVDGGINHSFLPIIMNKKYPTLIVNKLNLPKNQTITIGGPLCTSKDLFSSEVDLPDVEANDIVGIFNSGAYGFSASMLYFLSHPLPAEILIHDAKPVIVRERSKVEDFLINQKMLQYKNNGDY